MKSETWLHISNTGLTIFESGHGKSGLPSISVTAQQSAHNPIQLSEQFAPWVKAHGQNSINILLHHSLYQLLLSDVPDVPESELSSAIELKAADLLNYDIDDALLDVIQLPKEAYRGRMRMAFIVATPKAPLRDWLIALAKSGTKVDVIDVDTTALRNLAIAQQTYSEAGIIHLKPSSSRLLLNYKREMVLSRSFDIGLNRLLSAPSIDDGELEVTNDDPHSDIQIESLVLEIRRSFDYYESQLGLGSIAELMILCDQQYSNIATLLAEKLGVRLSLIEPGDFMSISSRASNSEPSTFYSLAGVAFRGLNA